MVTFLWLIKPVYFFDSLGRAEKSSYIEESIFLQRIGQEKGPIIYSNKSILIEKGAKGRVVRSKNRSLMDKMVFFDREWGQRRAGK